MTTFSVTFRTEHDHAITVGDELDIHVRATVAGIRGELVEVTSFSAREGSQVQLGEVTVELYANHGEVVNRTQIARADT